MYLLFFNITNLLNINAQSSINIPEYLKYKNIQEIEINFVADFCKSFNIKTFSEVTIDLLNEYAKNNYENAIKLNTLLGLYGVEFIGKSSKKYSPNSRNIIKLIKCNIDTSDIYSIKLFKNKYKNLELKFLDYFNKIGLTESKYLNGINISVLLDKLNLFNIDIENLIDDFDRTYIQICEPDNFYDKDNIDSAKNTFNDKINDVPICNTELSTRTVNCLLANNIDTIGKLLNMNIDDFRQYRNMGKKTVEEIENFLESDFKSTIRNKDLIIVSKNDNKIKNSSPVISQEDYIDLKLWNVNLSELTFSSKLLNKLKDNDIITIGDFLSNKNNNAVLSNYEINIIFNTLSSFGINKNIKYTPKELILPEIYFQTIQNIFNDEWILNACKKFKLKNIGLLANNFPDIFSQDDELCCQDVFFEKILTIENQLKQFGINDFPTKLSYFQVKELNKKTIDEIININYVQKIIDVLQLIFNAKNDNVALESKQIKTQLKEKEVDILQKRFGINGNVMILDEIGQLYGCTRERIRQIESKSIKKLIENFAKDFQGINSEIKLLIETLGNIIVFDSITDNNWQKLIEELLKKQERFFDIDFKNNLILSKDFNINKIYEELTTELNNFNQEQFSYLQISKELEEILQKYINNVTEIQNKNFSKVHTILLNIFTSDYLINLQNDIYKLTTNEGNKGKQERNEKVIYLVEKLYPEGIHLPIDNNEELQNNLKKLYDNCPEIKDLNLRSVSDRLIKQDKNIIWWGRGLYIHINNTNVNLDIVDFAIDEIVKKFDSGIHRFKPNIIFKLYEEKFIEAGIPNEIALMGLIKYKNNPRIDTQRQELRDAKNSDTSLNILGSFEQYIANFPNGINRSELIHEMCNKRGWKPHQIEFLYSRSKLIYKNNNSFIHKANISINNEKLNELINIIERELNGDSTSFLHLRKIHKKYPATWVGVTNKDISENFMGRLLIDIDNINFTIDNYVYAVDNSISKQNNTTLYNVLYEFTKKQSENNRFVTLNEIIEFCKKQGLKDTKQPIVDCLKRFCFEYSENAFVHSEILGYTDEIQEDIAAIIQIISEKNTNTPLYLFDEIIQEYSDLLPALNEDYDWNMYLLKNAFSKFEILDIFEKTFIFKDNKFGVEDLDDTAAYLMMKNCENGYCKFKELDKLLARFGVTPYKNLHFYKSRLFFEGSSIKSVDNDTAVAVEKFARDKYSNV